MPFSLNSLNKKILSAALALFLAVPFIAGCASGPEPAEGPPPGSRLTTDGRPAPPDALDKPGDAPPSDLPPPGQIGKMKKGGG